MSQKHRQPQLAVPHAAPAQAEVQEINSTSGKPMLMLLLLMVHLAGGPEEAAMT